MECVLYDEPLVPIFNCGNDEVIIPEGSIVGYVEPENAKLERSKLVLTNLAEVTYAVNNNILAIEEIDLAEIPCNAVVPDDAPSLPSLEGADITGEQKSRASVALEQFQDVFGYTLKPGASIPGVTGVLKKQLLPCLMKN